MNDLRIKSVSFTDHAFKVEFSDGPSIELPLELFAELNVATPPEPFEQGKWGVHRYLSH